MKDNLTHPVFCHVFEAGRLDLHTARRIQDNLAKEIANDLRPGCFILFEHPLTYTGGTGIPAEKLELFRQKYGSQEIQLELIDGCSVSRVFGPGQLRGVFLLKEGKINRDIGDRKMEEMLIILLSRLGLAAGQISGKPGVWLQANVASRCPRCRPEDRKKPARIADVDTMKGGDSIWRSGFTLNLDPDMEMIEALGDDSPTNGPFVSLEDIFPELPDFEIIKSLTFQSFAECFDVQIIQQKFDILD